MDPESIKPAGLPNTQPLATPPPSPAADPMLAQPEPLPVMEHKKQEATKAKPDDTRYKQPKNSNVAIAIIATVIIVLGISALAVYAYMKH